MPVSKCIPKSEIEVLSQEIDEELGMYRIQAGNKVRYLTIAGNVFDEDTMCRPYLLIPKLPIFPNTPWTKMDITRAADGTPLPIISNTELRGVDLIWHPDKIQVLSLKQTRRYRHNVHEVMFKGVPAITKIVRWEWELARMENETWAYSLLHRHQCKHPDEPPIGPQFLGHLSEDGRVMGMLLEKVQGRFTGPDDLLKCEELVRRVHRLGLIHGDVNRHNFLVNEETGDVRLLDFEHVEEFDEEVARAELEALPLELAEETGRGSTGEL
ncbi:hypothetical protein MferCBS31731_003605 [Microsporum ferrugineum]